VLPVENPKLFFDLPRIDGEKKTNSNDVRTSVAIDFYDFFFENFAYDIFEII